MKFYTPVNEMYVTSRMSALDGVWNEQMRTEGSFVTAVVNFLILAFVIYQIVRVATRFNRPTEAATPAPSDELIVLREIRDELKARGGA